MIVDWRDGVPGSLTFTDDCGGGQTVSTNNRDSFIRNWRVTAEPGATCTATVRATSLQGVEGAVAASFTVVAPDPPPEGVASSR